MNVNEHNFMSVVPLSAFPKEFDFTIGQKAEILVIGKGMFRDCIVVSDLAYTINKDKTQVIIINLKKGKSHIRVLLKN